MVCHLLFPKIIFVLNYERRLYSLLLSKMNILASSAFAETDAVTAVVVSDTLIV